MSERPKRIQLRRTKGWRLPDGAVSVARPTKWGNPFRVEHHGRKQAVEMYRQWMRNGLVNAPDVMLSALADLRGRDLACWCPLDQPCHADVLLEMANEEPPA